MPETVLRVGVDSRPAVAGGRRAEAALGRMGKKAVTTEGQFKKLGNRMAGMRTIFASLGIGLVIRQFTGLLDATTTIDNKIRVVTNSTGELNAVFEELEDVSRRTRTSLEVNAGLFQRIGLATKSLGLTFKEQTSLIEGFNQAVIISGTNPQEARAVTTQFAQGIGAGFKGDELRSIIEQSTRVAEVISDDLGLRSVQALKKFASEGKLTPQVVVDAFRRAQVKLAAEFKKVKITIEQGTQVLRNSLISIVRDFNKASPASFLIGGALRTLAGNLDIVAGAAGGLSLMLLRKLVPAMLALSKVLLTNPVVLLGVALVALGATLASLGRTVFAFGDTTATGFQIMKAAMMTLVQVAQPLLNFLNEGFQFVAQAVANFVNDGVANLPSFSTVVKTVFNFVLSTVKAAAGIIPLLFKNIPASLELIFVTAANKVISVFESIINGFLRMGTLLAGAVPGIGKIGTFLSDTFVTAANFIAKAYQTILGGLLVLVSKTSDAIAPVAADLAADLRKSVSEGLKAGLSGDDIPTVSFARLGLSEEATSTGKAIQAVIQDAFSTDTINAFGAAVGTNLATVQTQAKLAAVDMELLNNRFSPKRGDAPDDKAIKKLASSRKSFIDGLNSDFDSLRSETGEAQEVVREWFEGQKVILADLGLSWEDYGGKLTAVFDDKLKDAYKKDLDAATDWASGIERAAVQLQESIGNSSDASQDAFETWFGGMEDSLTDFFTTGKLSVKDFADDMLNQLTRIAVQQAIIKPLAGLFTGAAGGGGGLASLAGSFFSGGAGLFKEGGLSTKPVETLPQFAAGGLTSGGFPAILHPDEAVIPLSRNRKIPVDMPGGGGPANNITFNITTPDADSFKRSEQQIFARASASMSRASKRNN